jgi:hypothetical protein
LLKIFENWEIIFIIINKIDDNYLFLSSRLLKGRAKINKGGKEGKGMKK